MNLNPRSTVKLARIVRYGAVALITAWSLLALASYAVLAAISGWMASLNAADGWIAWSGQLLREVGGPVIGILWLGGTLVIIGAMAVIRRFAA
ncbi:hypothetical protein [Mesorhizobium sp. KR9-304]|uniref:hypothetical protein n=1 Tax=Mesorhizobium sp. KR9-304 TaxID=3156614 RepID=UPI0032B350C4